MTHILIVEDEKEIVKLLKYNLENEGYSLTIASDGEVGLREFRKSPPELILLDLMIPKISGVELCKIIRKESQVPIIMLTAKREETDRVLGLELGADDYMTKPFSVRELTARIKTVLRRIQPRVDAPAERVIAGKLQVDFARYEVKVGDKIVELSSKEFAFLKALIEANGRVLTRDQLLEKIWGIDQSMEIDTRTVDQHVARLRAKLGAESNRVATVKNIGYKFKQD